jgi:hypothetical protein
MSAPKPTINDGGPAFPIADSYCPNGQVQYGHNGMTLRDYFAGQAIAGLAIQTDLSDVALANYAWGLADAMIAARRAEGVS